MQHSLKPGNIRWLIFMKCVASKGLNFCKRRLWEDWWTWWDDSDKMSRLCENVATWLCEKSAWRILECWWKDYFFFHAKGLNSIYRVRFLHIYHITDNSKFSKVTELFFLTHKILQKFKIRLNQHIFGFWISQVLLYTHILYRYVWNKQLLLFL